MQNKKEEVRHELNVLATRLSIINIDALSDKDLEDYRITLQRMGETLGDFENWCYSQGYEF